MARERLGQEIEDFRQDMRESFARMDAAFARIDKRFRRLDWMMGVLFLLVVAVIERLLFIH